MSVLNVTHVIRSLWCHKMPTCARVAHRKNSPCRPLTLLTLQYQRTSSVYCRTVQNVVWNLQASPHDQCLSKLRTLPYFKTLLKHIYLYLISMWDTPLYIFSPMICHVITQKATIYEMLHVWYNVRNYGHARVYNVRNYGHPQCMMMSVLLYVRYTSMSN